MQTTTNQPTNNTMSAMSFDYAKNQLLNQKNFYGYTFKQNCYYHITAIKNKINKSSKHIKKNIIQTLASEYNVSIEQAIIAIKTDRKLKNDLAKWFDDAVLH